MIPQELRNQKFWCVWKREMRGGQKTKIPYNPMTGERAESDNPATFGSFDLADERYLTEDYDGVGIRLSGGYSAVDIDHCVQDGVISDLALSIINELQSYTEFSPSKEGLRIIFKTHGFQYDSQKYYMKNPHNGVEVYISGATNRFVTITGNTLYDYPVRDITKELPSVLDAHMVRPAKKSADKQPSPEPPVSLTDEQIIAKASNNPKFYSLFHDGNLTDYNGDASSADLALCNILAFWTGRNEAQMDSIFRQSALYRPDKWGARADYRSMTIGKAIADCDEIYNPSKGTVCDRLGTPDLITTPWIVTTDGVFIEEVADKRTGETKSVPVTSTPILPVRIMVNADTGIHKIELSFRKYNTRRTIIQELETIANKGKIVSLANLGVNVTTKTAGRLVDFLDHVQQKNMLPEVTSVSHLGWVDNKFLPYDDDVVFDGEASDRKLFNSIKSHGSESVWLEHVLKLRKNKALRMTMAASFASPLIEKCGALPFVFHLWGTTGGGKTVALKVAMSIWGKSELGDLVYTMNMTDNAMMNTAGLLYSLPFAGDELQLVKSQYGYDRLIMRVTEGIDRGRMKYDAKVAQRTWKNAFIFTGEEPCTNYNSGGGTKNRVVEVNADSGVVEDGGEAISIVSENYGYAGKTFIDYAKTQNLRARYGEIRRTISDVTDKQAVAATMVLLGDAIARECLFPSEQPLTWEDISEYFLNSEDVSTAERAKEYIIGWLAQNQNKFSSTMEYGDCWGVEREGSIFIIANILEDELNRKGFSFEAVKREWGDSGWLVKYQNKYKKRKRICNQSPYCVELVLSFDHPGE